MVVSLLPVLMVHSRGCCADGRCCNGTATPQSAALLREAVEDLAVEFSTSMKIFTMSE
jgi:hypothetical protein